VLRDGQLVEDDLWVADGKIVNGQEWFFGEQTQVTNRLKIVM